jgi:cob(I)alamin adenosyltransferase
MLTIAPVAFLEEHNMSIYTRQGDTGETSLANGARVRKDAARVEAYGAIDEAGSTVGLARTAATDPYVVDLLRFIQQRLMNCAALTARPLGDASSGQVAVAADDVAALERAIDSLSDRTGPWTGFVLEAESEAAARLHLARSIIRRAERRLVTLSAHEPVDPQVLAFLNRSSDALYAAARVEYLGASCTEEPWDPSAAPDF